MRAHVLVGDRVHRCVPTLWAVLLVTLAVAVAYVLLPAEPALAPVPLVSSAVPTARAAVTGHGTAASLPLPAPRPTASRASRSRRLDSESHLHVTGYCWTGHRTASGVWPELGMAAGNRWPLGTRLLVDGVGALTVTDRIGWGSDLDVYLGRGQACQRAASTITGRRHVEVLP